MLIPSLLVVLVLSAGSSSVAAEAPAVRAEKLAMSFSRIRSHLESLRAEAALVSDPTRKSDLLEVLDRPVFQIVKLRRAQEQEIVTKLRKAGLIDAAWTGPLFPAREPMRFVAAPGGPGVSHHVYPGGLVYHTLFNLKTGLAYIANYRDLYGVTLDSDLVRMTAIWHDMAKTYSIAWDADGSATPGETQIAATGAHHIYGIAEALIRGWSPGAIVALASAHSPPVPGKDEQSLIDFLKAGAIVSGKSFEAAGLNADGSALAALPSLEAFINHLDDHDYILSSLTQKQVTSETPGTAWERHRILAKDGDIAIYPASRAPHGR